MEKVFIEVVVKYTIDGRQIPLAIIWETGKKYHIDRVIDVKRAASLKAGGQGLRYKCRIKGLETFLWLEDDKWFVEKKE